MKFSLLGTRVNKNTEGLSETFRCISTKNYTSLAKETLTRCCERRKALCKGFALYPITLCRLDQFDCLIVFGFVVGILIFLVICLRQFLRCVAVNYRCLVVVLMSCLPVSPLISPLAMFSVCEM